MAILLFFIGIVASAFFSGEKVKNNLLQDISIDFYFQPETDLQKISLIQNEIHKDPRVAQVSFTSADEALQQNMLLAGEAIDSVLMELDGENPMPPVLDVSLQPMYFQADSLDNFTSYYEEKYAKEISEIFYPEAELKDVLGNMNKIGYFAMGIALLMGLVSVLLINNTIKLSMYSNRFLIKTMQLVGATNMFIQGPFLRNALIQAMTSGFMAFGMLFGLIYIMVSYNPDLALIFDFMLYIKIFVVIFVLGIVLSLWFTFFAVRKYTRTNIDKLY